MSERYYYIIVNEYDEPMSFPETSEPHAIRRFTVGRWGGYGNDITKRRLEDSWQDFKKRGYRVIKLAEQLEKEQGDE
jgi:hypothetical protein